DPSKGPNIVKSVSPSQGSPLSSGQSVTLFVVNLTNGTPTAPIMAITPATMTFGIVVGQPTPPAQSIAITNSGGGSLSWQATVTTAVGGSWLSIDQGSGSIASKQSTLINVSAAVISGLIPGTYTGTITITATDALGHTAIGGPQSISVVLIVLRH